VSIDLYVGLNYSVSLRALLPKASAILAEMLGLESLPDLTLEMLKNGQRESVVNDELHHESSSLLFLISIAGEPETVGLTVPGKAVALVMGAQRTALEYALGAAIAISLARQQGSHVEDDWRFFGDVAERSPEDLLQRLKIPKSGLSYRDASEQFAKKIGIGPDDT
jgi:hypothetical protein